jgi:hypothetical protein
MCFVALERFQEHHWPKRIANPLPYDTKIDPPSRLLSACKSLNKNLESIRFKVGDGGESLSWEKIENSP